MNDMKSILDNILHLSASGIDPLAYMQENLVTSEQLEVELASMNLYCSICGSCGDQGCGCTHKCKFSFEHPDVLKKIDELEDEIKVLRETIDTMVQYGK
jgi:hypothetical protein